MCNIPQLPFTAVNTILLSTSVHKLEYLMGNRKMDTQHCQKTVLYLNTYYISVEGKDLTS